MSAPNYQRNEQIVRAAQSGTTPTELAAEYGVQPPAICKILRRAGINLAPARTPTSTQRARVTYDRRTMAEKREQAPIAVDRDPCPQCGVRGDIGCKHKRIW